MKGEKKIKGNFEFEGMQRERNKGGQKIGNRVKVVVQNRQCQLENVIVLWVCILKLDDDEDKYCESKVYC